MIGSNLIVLSLGILVDPETSRALAQRKGNHVLTGVKGIASVQSVPP